MSHPYHHALSSVKKWGGEPEDYQAIHDWFDETKAHFADFRHRALRHHSEGIFMAERQFGPTIKIATGRDVSVRLIGEQHVRFIPRDGNLRRRSLPGVPEPIARARAALSPTSQARPAGRA